MGQLGLIMGNNDTILSTVIHFPNLRPKPQDAKNRS